LSRQHRKATSPDREADEQAEAAKETESKQKSEDVLALTDEVLDDIDRELKKACGFDADQMVTDESFEDAAYQLVASYQQKGGQ
jgi:hypothetical protein